KNTTDYQALPRKVSQQVLRILDKNWKSFFEAHKAYIQCPHKFTGRPKLPKYKHKTQGRNLLIYTIQAISKPWLKKQRIKLSGTNIIIPTQAQNIAQARIIPKIGQYVIEIVYEKPSLCTVNNPEAIAAIDLGVDNLVALTSNQKGFIPILVNGRPLKSINQFYNKRKAFLQSLLKGKQQTSQLIQRITANRNNRIDTYLHQASRWIINHLDKHGISQLIIGKNPFWKLDVNNGKRNNQSFVNIPHDRFIEMLIYKGAIKGIKVITAEESYTSRASFLHLDFIPNYGDDQAKNIKFSGYRETRGTYKIKGQKSRINADVNGSYNILRKVIPTAFSQGIEGVVVRPTRITPGVAKI
ncbi:MAG: transposase, partial [Xenococcaceae cyanobacterium MO_207.B15]|nr:transposase [Xenococcaceae cyanobacterium MO_207.B15]